MNHGELYLRPEWNRKLKIMAKRASIITKVRGKFRGNKGQPSRKKVPVFISMEPSGRGNRPIQICELVLEVRE